MGVNQAHEAGNEERADKAILNCIPALRGKTDRQNFVIKTYSIIFCMLFITVCFTAGMVNNTFGNS
jgi:FtsH-binding integral membrane protein